MEYIVLLPEVQSGRALWSFWNWISVKYTEISTRSKCLSFALIWSLALYKVQINVLIWNLTQMLTFWDLRKNTDYCESRCNHFYPRQIRYVLVTTSKCFSSDLIWSLAFVSTKIEVWRKRLLLRSKKNRLLRLPLPPFFILRTRSLIIVLFVCLGMPYRFYPGYITSPNSN